MKVKGAIFTGMALSCGAVWGLMDLGIESTPAVLPPFALTVHYYLALASAVWGNGIELFLLTFAIMFMCFWVSGRHQLKKRERKGGIS